MEEQEDGAQIVRVERIALLSVLENVLFAKALDIKQLSAETAESGPPNIGGGKKAGADAGAGTNPGTETQKLSKGARRRQNQAKRKEEEERQKAEADQAAKAASLKTFTASDSEDDSPKKPVYVARQARLTGGKSRSLYKELNEMASGSRPQDVEKLGEEIFKA